MIARLLGLCAVVLALAACGGRTTAGGPGGGDGPSGVEGTVMISPAQNTCPATRSCSKPAPGVTLVFSRDGKVVATTKTDKHGGYRVGLPAGHYSIAVPGKGALAPTVKPATATVDAGHFSKLDLELDVGIR